MNWLINYVKSIYWNENEPRLRAREKQLRAADLAENQRRASMYGPWDNIPWPDDVHVDPMVWFELTTREFVEQYVVPATASIRAPLYALVPLPFRGRPRYFLSHAWANLISAADNVFRVTGTTESFSNLLQGDECVWIDIVCYNQHAVVDDRIAFDMEKLIASIGTVVFPVTSTQLFDRTWCLWELLAGARHNAKFIFSSAGGRSNTEYRIVTRDFMDSFRSVEESKATKPEDREILLRAMITQFGTIKAADEYIRRLLKELDPYKSHFS